MNELISVIVPIYNVEQYLKQCIDSILNQTYQNLEIILVDDGSPDNCGKICDEYALKDKRIKVIHKENGGLSSARNAGLDIATGMYVSFIDSDDYIHCTFIESLYCRIVKDHSNIAQCDFTRNKEEINQKSKYFNDSVYLSEEAIENLNNIDVHGHYVIVCNKLYNVNLFKNIRFPIGKIHEDTFVSYLLFDLSHKVSVLSKKLYFYRNTSSSITKAVFSLKRLDALEGYECERDYFKKKNKKLFYSTCSLYALILKDYYFDINKSSIIDKKQYKREIIQKGRKNIMNVIKSRISIQKKIEIFLFFSFPILYCKILVKILDTIKK